MSVVPLAQFRDPEREATRKKNTEILGECRDLVLDRLCDSIKSALDRVEADLLKRQEAVALSSEERRLYAETQLQLKMIKADLDKRFRAVFQRSFNSTAAGIKQIDNVYNKLTDLPMQLSLVDTEQQSDEVALKKLAKTLKNKCDDELSELAPRLAYLLGEEQIDPDRDPLGPEAITKVLRDVCFQLDSSKQVKLVILSSFCGNIGEELSKVYAELNDHLIGREVLPRLRRSVRRQPSTDSRRSPESHAKPTDGAGEGEWFADLVRLAASRTPGLRAADTVASPTEGRELVSILDRLQHGAGDGIEAIVIAEGGGGFANVLKNLRESSLGSHVGFANGLIIDIVATMFDFIFEDPRVPSAMKGLIGRLQIPVLKVALIDRAFFSTRSHPARRMLNQLAEAAEEWGAEFGPHAPLYQKAESLIARIQSEFNDDLSVINECQAELERFLAEQELVAERKAADMAPGLVEQEKRELALSAARGAIWLYTADSSLPEPVTAFLGTHWVHVLANAFLLGGEQGHAWQSATNTMDRLIWSVMPKQGAEERRELVQLLPQLLRQLRTGLDSTGAAAEVRERFFGVLVGLHASAVRAGMSAAGFGLAANSSTASPPAPQAAAAAEAAPPATEQRASAPPPADARADAAPEPELLSSLKRGTWLEMGAASEQPARVRLSWISPACTMYLFTNRQGEQAIALSRRELIQRFESGELRLADDASLIDQVVEHVIDNLKTEYSIRA